MIIQIVNYPHIAFDLDGTLVDSRRDLADSANALVARHGGQPLATDVVVRMVGEGARRLVERVISAANLAVSVDEALIDFLRFYDERLTAHTRPYDGVVSTLEALAARHTLTVLTNKPEPATRRLLHDLDLARYFRLVVGGDSRVPRKPAPDGLVYLMAAVGTSAADTLLVGDSSVDVETARNAGCAVCLARYGFGFDAVPDEVLSGVALTIDRPEDLLAIVKRPRRAVFSRRPCPE